MQQLFGILFRARNFLLFVALESLCILLIRKNNLVWDINLFNSSNAIAAKSMAYTYDIKEYLNLKQVNKSLAEENLALLQKLNSTSIPLALADSSFLNRYSYILALVVNNSTGFTKNYLTINKGRKQGLKPGMAVIGPKGIVGQVMKCSENFSTVYSILHVDFKVSAEVISKKLEMQDQVALGVSNWNARSHRAVKLNNIDKFKEISIGDTVVTSSQNLVFPPGIMVGRISGLADKPEFAFWDIDVSLSSDLNGLRYVYVLENKFTEEQKELESQSKE